MAELVKPDNAERRVLLVEDDHLQANALSRALESLGIRVVGPFGSIALAMRQVTSNQSLEGAILDLNLGGEWVYPLATTLTHRGVPFVFWTGYDYLELPGPHQAASLVPKPATAEELVSALFDAAREAADLSFADVYVTVDSEYLLMLGGDARAESDPVVHWLGSTMLSRAAWSRTLRLPLRDGIFYRVPSRYATALKLALTIIG